MWVADRQLFVGARTFNTSVLWVTSDWPHSRLELANEKIIPGLETVERFVRIVDEFFDMNLRQRFR
jgi:hypothetical protein